MPLFGKSQKAPLELTRQLAVNLEALAQADQQGAVVKSLDKARDEVCKMLGALKMMTLGQTDPDIQKEASAALSSESVNDPTFLRNLIHVLPLLDFEAKKDTSQLIVYLIRREIGQRQPVADFFATQPRLLSKLVLGYQNPEAALCYGQILREAVRQEQIARIVLNSEEFYGFFKFVESSTFDVASDAFLTFKDLLTRHKTVAADFLEKNYDRFFGVYLDLLNSENYVTRRQALKLLGELLLDRHNFSVMTRYISSADNMKLMMNLLREKSKNIQFEAFHVFKVFVANPNKPRPILEILLRNQEKLIDFLSKFQSERTDDDQFNDEKAYLIKQIRELKPLNCE